jgi:hypothetical protein
MNYGESRTKKWVWDRESINQKVRQTNDQHKTMTDVFLGVDGVALLNVRAQGWKLTSITSENIL